MYRKENVNYELAYKPYPKLAVYDSPDSKKFYSLDSAKEYLIKKYPMLNVDPYFHGVSNLERLKTDHIDHLSLD